MELDNPAGKVLSMKSIDHIDNLAMDFYQHFSTSIEVNFKDKLVKVFFPLLPSCFCL